MTAKEKEFEVIRKLLAVAFDPAAPEGERKAANGKIDKLLAKHKARLSDVIGDQGEEPKDAPADDVPDKDTNKVPLWDDLVGTLRSYLYMRGDGDHEIVALWILHTYVFDRFRITPRIVFHSPLPGCGKSTTLDVLKVLCAKVAEVPGDATSASLRELLCGDKPTILLDEGDNAKLAADARFRSILNSGHMRGRQSSTANYSVETFAPVGLAAIDLRVFPQPLRERSIQIFMTKRPARVPHRELDDADAEEVLEALKLRLRIWNKNQAPKINVDPSISPEVSNRNRNNWRPLIAVADMFGVGKRARELAINRRIMDEEDIRTKLITDIKRVFDNEFASYIQTSSLPHFLCNLDPSWYEYRGPKGTNPSRMIRADDIADLLAPWQIKSKSIWPEKATRKERKERKVKSFKAYERSQFAVAWASVCPDEKEEAEEADQPERPVLKVVN